MTAQQPAYPAGSVIITGASEGIGRALALALAGAGVQLTLAARSVERLRATAADCEARGAAVLAVPTDVAQREQCEALVAAAVQRFGRIDALVNNAGVTMWARFDAVADPSVFETLMRVNYLGSVYATRAALPHLQRSQGLIVAVASVAGLTGVPERTGYAASKHAMIGFFESLRIELAGSGVDMTIVAPDFVRSEIHRRAIGADGTPLGTTPMQESKIMTADACAALIVRAMQRRDRMLVTSLRGRLGRLLKPFVPTLLDRIAARAIRERR